MKALNTLNKFFYKYRGRLALGALFVAISVVFKIFPAIYVRKSFDLVEQALKAYTSDAINFELSDFQGQLILYGIIIIAASLLNGLFTFFMRQTIIVVSRFIEYDLKNDIFDQYQKLSLAFYKRNNTGDLMNRISEDVSRVRMYIGPAIMYTLNTGLLLLMVIPVMLQINMKLTLYVLIPLPILAVVIFYISKKINIKSEQVQRQLSSISTFVQEAFSGIRVLKAYTREDDSLNKFKVEADHYLKKNEELYRINALFFPFMILLIGLSTILTVYIGGQEVFAGNISTGNIAEFIMYVNYLTWPVASIGWVTSLVQRAAASQERINEFMNVTPEIKNESEEPFHLKGDIEFKNVSFVYPDTGIKALDDVSFKVKAGQSLAIIGKTGSGKSTIATLLTRLYDTTHGQVLIDGKPIKELNLYDLRKAIGYVPQEVFLFSSTIGENIAFGIENANPEKIEFAAKQAQVHENIIDFPKGYQTRVGERGITLSGGQKQRVSIARAIAKNPQLLIFDDCLSAVDTETEEKILSNLRSIIKQRTTIIISHRVSTVKDADSILVLEKGKIIEQGSHDELLKANGYYTAMYEQQLIEEPKNMVD